MEVLGSLGLSEHYCVFNTCNACFVFVFQSGQICLKTFPQLVLGVSDKPLYTYITDPNKGVTEVQAEGFVVSLQQKQSGNSRQQWQFTSDGFIKAEVVTLLRYSVSLRFH